MDMKHLLQVVFQIFIPDFLATTVYEYKDPKQHLKLPCAHTQPHYC